MKTVSVRALKPGMVLARPVLDKNRDILLDSGIEITAEYIEKLKSRKIRMVSILEDEEDDMEDEVLEDEEEEEESPDTFIQELNTLNTLGFQEAYELLKKAEKNLDKPGIEKALVTFLKTADNDKLIQKSIDILGLIETPKSKVSNMLDIFVKQTSSSIKSDILKFFQKLSKDTNVIKPLIYSMKNNDNFSNNEIYKLFVDYEKSDVEKHCYSILGENDSSLNTHVISLMKKLGLSNEGESAVRNTEAAPAKPKPAPVKIVKKVEKIAKVEKAEEKLAKIEAVGVTKVNDFNSVDENSFADKLSKGGGEEVKFSQIDYSNADDALFAKEYEQSIFSTENVIMGARANQIIDSKKIIEIANKIVSQVMHDPMNAVKLSEFNTLNNYVISHSINTAYMGVLVGYLKGLDHDLLMDLAIGGLLHDIGMVKVRDLIWNVPQKLGFNDVFDIQKHTIYGIDTLAEISKFKGNIAYIAYQHHERLDGSGYPKKKKGIQVAKDSRIIGLADTFMAMTSSRVYRAGYDLNFAFNTLLRKDKDKFDQGDVKLLHDFYVENVSSDLSNLGPELKTILIVDDSPEIRMIAQKLYQKEFTNVDIISAENGRVAMDMLTDGNIKPDLILLDIMMPDMDGFMVLDEMKLKNMNIPVFMLTAKREQSSVVRTLQSGIVKDYIVKPFEKELLMEKSRKIIYG